MYDLIDSVILCSGGLTDTFQLLLLLLMIQLRCFLL